MFVVIVDEIETFLFSFFCLFCFKIIIKTMPFLSDLHKYQSKTTYSLARIQNDRRKDRGGEGRKRKAESKKTL